MTYSAIEELINLLKDQKKDIPILEYRVKDIYSITGLILTVIDSGFFSMMMNILNLWSKKHYNATIKISYQSVNDEQIEITYTRLNRKATEDLLSNHPPKVGNKLNLEIQQPE